VAIFTVDQKNQQSVCVKFRANLGKSTKETPHNDLTFIRSRSRQIAALFEKRRASLI
jgi:hypothetical protein